MFLLSHWKAITSQTEIYDEHRKSEIIAKFLLKKEAHADVKSEYLNDDVPVLENCEFPPISFSFPPSPASASSFFLFDFLQNVCRQS